MNAHAHVPAEAHYWSDLTFEDDLIERRISLDAVYVRALAAYVGESTSYAEAIRMAVSQGAMMLKAGNAHGWCSPPEMDELPEPTVSWYDEIADKDVAKNVTFTRRAVEDVALAAPEFLTFPEAVMRCLNVALADRSRLRCE